MSRGEPRDLEAQIDKQELVRGFGILLTYFLASVVGAFVVRLLPVPRSLPQDAAFHLAGSIFVLVYGLQFAGGGFGNLGIYGSVSYPAGRGC